VGFVAAHQGRVARDVREHDGGEAARFGVVLGQPDLLLEALLCTDWRRPRNISARGFGSEA